MAPFWSHDSSGLLKLNARVISIKREEKKRNKERDLKKTFIQEDNGVLFIFLCLGLSWQKDSCTNPTHRVKLPSEVGIYIMIPYQFDLSVQTQISFLYDPLRGAVYWSAVPNRMSKALTRPGRGFDSQRGPTRVKN